MQQYDLIVIGAGSGGVRTARQAAARGWRVAIAEERFAGGTCVNVGCVPKKLMSFAAGFPHLFELSKGFGWSWTQSPSLDWGTLKRNRDEEIARLQAIYRRLLDNSGVHWFGGHASLESAHRVRVGETILSADRILIATGSSAWLPDIPGKENLAISDALFDLPSLPKRVVVWGGGYIATEFASILNGLGSDVTIVHRGPHVLNRFDQESAQHLHDSLKQQGIRMCMEATIASVTRLANGYQVTLGDGEKIAADIVFCAIGRVANTHSLGLDKLGITLDAHGNIVVNEALQTSVPGVYALGDVTGGAQLTPVALREGMNLIDQWFNDGCKPLPLDLIPNAVFSHPCYASVGLSEEAAREQYTEVLVFRSRFEPMDHSLGDFPDKVFIKLLVDARTDRLLGAHMIGEGAAEVIQGVAMAMTCGATKSALDATLGIHPTVAEEWVTLREPS